MVWNVSIDRAEDPLHERPPSDSFRLRSDLRERPERSVEEGWRGPSER